ncbi:aerobic respiration control sensor protein ArcB [Salmonella enterica subsp. enterica]|uniref:histidine kinase n=1 Tax=Salmonella enterica I TaxID=59201 RepID=A0A3S4LU30_SALET|nr:aerobic respiration control sensor protein ArcB [Salmonella enterica subsp. enterica]
MITNPLISPALWPIWKNLSGLQAQQKGLRFVLEPTLPLPHKVITDGTRLRQILWNLISNAVKFTQQGQVTVRARYDEGDMLHFEVEDSGIGIPQDEQDKIFAMYYQVKDSNGGKTGNGYRYRAGGLPSAGEKYGRRYYRFQSAGQRIDLYANGSCASGGGRGGGRL